MQGLLVTEQDIFLVAGLASAAIVITLADLLFSWWRHRRRLARALISGEAGPKSPEEAAAVARREAIRRRLAAIQAASSEQ